MPKDDMIVVIDVGDMPSMHKVETFKDAIEIIKGSVGTDKKKVLQHVRDGNIAIYKRDGKKELRIKAHFL